MKRLPGIIVGTHSAEERCGKCGRNFKVSVYLDINTNKRYQILRCLNCNCEFPPMPFSK